MKLLRMIKVTTLAVGVITYADYASARYLQADPKGLAAGINQYAYALNNPLKYIDPLGLEVTMTCRPVEIFGVRAVKHCAVVVWRWQVDDCERKKVIVAQYSLEENGTKPTKNHAPWSTYDVDRMAFHGNFPGGGGENYDIPIPNQYHGNQAAFDQAVINSGETYSQAPYDAIYGPNSNTAADNIIERALGTVPNVPSAWQQNWGH